MRNKMLEIVQSKNKLIKNNLLCVILLIYTLSSLSQTDGAPNVKFSATPSVAALAQYVEAPVGYYSGTPNISIPLYTIDAGEIQLPINLSYHASGIKIAQEASWVGLGWSLNLGGTITREVRGREDFFQGISQGSNYTAYGYFFNHENYDDPFNDSVECVSNPYQINPGMFNVAARYENPQCHIKHDAEPDLFMFNFAGYSGKFFLQAVPPASGLPSEGKGILLDKSSNVKIEFDLTNDYSFTLTTPDGVIFEFNEKEKSTTDSWDSDSLINSPINTSVETIDSWLLTRIVLTNGEEINFDYTIASAPLNSLIRSSVIEEQTVELWGEVESCVPNFERHKEFFTITNNNSRQFLNKISWNGGEMVVNTNSHINSSLRKYINGSSPKVENIEIKNTNLDVVKKYEFTYGYFNDNYLSGSGTEQLEHLRLKLESLQEISNNNETTSPPPYKFEYYEDLNLPSKLSNQYDHWGYYNGVNYNDIMPHINKIPEMEVGIEAGEPKFITIRRPSNKLFNFGGDLNNTTIIEANQQFYANGGFFEEFEGAKRYSDFKYAQTATLKSIEYPTGGIQQFDYESNTYFKPKVYKKGSGGTGGRILNYFEFAYSPFVPYDGEVDQTGNTPNFYDFEVPTGQIINSVTFYYKLNKQVFDKIEPSNGYRLAVFKLDANGNEIQEVANTALSNNYADYIWQDVGTDYEEGRSNEVTVNTTLGEGEYRLRFEIYSIPFIGTNSIQIHEVDTDYLNPYGSNFLEGYINFETIAPFEQVTSIPAGGLRVKRITSPKNVREFTYEQNHSELGNISSGILQCDLEYFTSYLAEEHCSQGSGNYIANSTILRRKSNSNYNLTGSVSGNIVGYSTVIEDYVDIDTSEKIRTVFEYHNEKEAKIGFGAPNIPNFKNGKLKGIKKYKGDFLVEETKSFYDEVPFEIISGYSYKSPTPDYFQHQFSNYYDIETIFYPLSDTQTTKYFENGTYLTENTSYEYYGYTGGEEFLSPMHLNPSKIIKEVSGEESITNYHFPKEIAESPSATTEEINLANALIEVHRLNTPIQTEQYNYDSQKNEQTHLNTNKIEYVEENGLILPLLFKNAVGDDNLRTEIIYEKYDDIGNILEVSSPQSKTHTTYIWSYNKQYPVAKIENATFEVVKEVLNITNDADYFNFHENNLDDLSVLRTDSRLKDAMITTYTYKNLVGITSVTDPRGYKTTYHYDGMNRLKYVTDDNGNKLSENEYFYKNQQ